ncbi:hypothetical protein PC116_g8435 [Phytophthora cactorum]|nr:hypothetical protein Pcac1_g23189 [Phytophthora cactorum]KAG4243746.1 hypothetical protein PC116_g8435 [Phytophthora cactorum]
MLDDGEAEAVDAPSSMRPAGKAAVLTTAVCTSVSSRQIYAEKRRKRRRCPVCRWEGKYPPEMTNYCLTHGFCLCRVVHNRPAKPWMCRRQRQQAGISSTSSTTSMSFLQIWVTCGATPLSSSSRPCMNLGLKSYGDLLLLTRLVTDQAVLTDSDSASLSLSLSLSLTGAEVMT